jgi:hypothetical protein
MLIVVVPKHMFPPLALAFSSASFHIYTYQSTIDYDSKL